MCRSVQSTTRGVFTWKNRLRYLGERANQSFYGIPAPGQLSLCPGRTAQVPEGFDGLRDDWQNVARFRENVARFRLYRL